MVLYRYAFRFVLLFYSGFKGARQFQVTMLESWGLSEKIVRRGKKWVQK
jgi:hypothetical protein